MMGLIFFGLLVVLEFGDEIKGSKKKQTDAEEEERLKSA